MLLQTWSVDPLTYYRPVIEQNRTGAFFIQDPRVTWQNGEFQNIPWMTGVVQHEGAVRAAGKFLKIFEKILLFR